MNRVWRVSFLFNRSVVVLKVGDDLHPEIFDVREICPSHKSKLVHFIVTHINPAKPAL